MTASVAPAPARTVRENPARVDEIVGAVLESGEAGAGRAVALAGSAQVAWAARGTAERARLLLAAADVLEPLREEVAVLVSRESGKVLGDAHGEVGFALTVLRWYAGRAAGLLADRTSDDERGRLTVRRRPFGVVGAITPWNAPVILSMLKVAPALAAGNAIVVKPSPLAPFGVTRLLESLAAALPDEVLHVVQGDVPTATALVGHPGVHRVAFTGGETAGRAIAGLAGRSLTPSVLELGGNDPAILLPDAALDDAAYERLVMAAFATSGQVCMAIKRLYAPADRLGEVAEGIEAAARRVLRVGDPLHPGVSMGPVVTAASASRLEQLVADASARGAHATVLGTVDRATDLGRGHYVLPRLVTGVRDDDPVVAQEQFGPVLPLLGYDTVPEAVARANAGELGLGASVWSADEDRAFEIAGTLDAGFTFVNTHNRTGMALHAPFGGVKRSGWGREYGDEGLLEYAQECVAHAPAAFRDGGSGLAAAAYPG
jgi:acyl-CoA reductase-like NAD-dependent aldehyde dehydrogenase